MRRFLELFRYVWELRQRVRDEWQRAIIKTVIEADGLQTRDLLSKRIEEIRVERDQWQAKYEQLAETRAKEMREQIDWQALRLTGRTVHGAAPSQPHLQPSQQLQMPQGAGRPVRQHMRDVVNEQKMKTAEELTQFFEQEQAAFNQNKSA